MEFKRIIKEIRPRFFVMENVKGLLSAPVRHIPHSERNGLSLVGDEGAGSAFQIVRNELLSLGYIIKHGLVDAVHYGVPQFRERLIVLGSRDGEELFIPVPTHFQKHQSPRHRWQTLRQAIATIENEPGPGARYSLARQKLLDLIPEGGNWKSLPEDVIMGAMGGAYESAGGKVGFYRRLSYDQPSPTLVTSPVQKSTMLTHPTGAPPRPLSVREYARIQQFPDDWKFAGDVNSCYRQIGNAVPVGLGCAIGLTLISIANGDSTIHAKRTRGTSVHNMGTLLNMESIDLFENNAIEMSDQLI
jgi:DNA (cytosine-5)-methyltransferase 1